MIAHRLLLTAVLAGPAWGVDVTLPNILSNGSVEVETNSIYGNLDGPKIRVPANATTYDWWYFDIVSAASNKSTVITFYNDGPRGFPTPNVSLPLGVMVSGSFANNTLFQFAIPATEAVIINSQEQGIIGNWHGSGSQFTGSSLVEPDVEYVVSINSPETGIYGTATFRSRAPSHYPCSLNQPNSTEFIVPGIVWANAVPDALTTVDFVLHGERFYFDDGVGYHDKNWGDRPLTQSSTSWYWGHARLGNYSVVFWDVIAIDGTEHFSSYVARDGEVVSSTCANGSVLARPWGANSTYPPTNTTGPMQGLDVVFEIGNSQRLVTNITTGLLIADSPIYVRALGVITGYVEDRATGQIQNFTREGKVVFEEIKF